MSLFVATIGVAAGVIPAVALATPAAPKPTLAQVQTELNKLMVKNSQLVDAYNKAQSDLQADQKLAAVAVVDEHQANAAFEQARLAVSATVMAQYEGGSFSAAGALLTSHDGQSYIDELSTLDLISQHNAGVAAQLDASHKAADAATAHANALVADASKRVAGLLKQKQALDNQFAKQTALLHTLTAQQQIAFTNTLSAPVTAAALSLTKASVAMANVPGAAKKAVDFALAQIGKPYVYGAAGPDAFDCSGLTMASYASAGISLPHNAGEQYGYGQHISFANVGDLISKLKPGDLIFYYSPIGHVVIYVGGGYAVSASTEGVPIGEISLSNWDSDQITGATRIVSG